jgi:hypothetical protein
MPIDYQKGKIYTIRCHSDPDLIYVGSTCQRLSDRLGGHKGEYKRFQNGKGNNYTSFKIICYGDSYIELYEAYPCANKQELIKREGEVIRELKCVNKIVAGRTQKEYCEDNKETIKIKVAEKMTCDCGSTHRKGNKASHLKTKKHQNYINSLKFMIIIQMMNHIMNSK